MPAAVRGRARRSVADVAIPPPRTHGAGVTYSRSEIIHAIEMTPIGSVTLCAGTAIHRPLPGTFEDLRHDRCAECERLVGDPAATTATHQIVMI